MTSDITVCCLFSLPCVWYKLFPANILSNFFELFLREVVRKCDFHDASQFFPTVQIMLGTKYSSSDFD